MAEIDRDSGPHANFIKQASNADNHLLAFAALLKAFDAQEVAFREPRGQERDTAIDEANAVLLRQWMYFRSNE